MTEMADLLVGEAVGGGATLGCGSAGEGGRGVHIHILRPFSAKEERKTETSCAHEECAHTLTLTGGWHKPEKKKSYI